ncbi:hypothetical protein DMA12_08245 [Amycolatopsis balhimycina DSM 5908]|uniref:Uncharacterized protein n=1 Tax=Amycolatopsis balhimycina DSM 5908 TaxID=1081091 RepID=A0A428WX07_AMYBA|nr:hypothetical protein [Amycolatopsis balhimycina]RSM47624.1 hypothetical protein DMA12_08245 [Amycolatopsis balhimycina DSM 5908]
MPGPSIPDALAGLGAQIGQYFSVVSLVPSFFLTMWTTALVTSGSWGSGVPDLRKMVQGIGGLNLSGAAWLLLTAIVFALFLHPLQVGLTRLMEGYWGSSPLSRQLLRMRITRHRKRRAGLYELRNKLENRRDDYLLKLLREEYYAKLSNGSPQAEDPDDWDERQRKFSLTTRLLDDDAHPVSGLHAAAASIPAALGDYPSAARVMPTRFGNVLRQAEDTIGDHYGLKAIRTTPHLALVSPELHLNYLQDTRQQMDTAVRLCATALAATAESLLFLATDGWWLLVALAPYLLAYLSYRASVAAAREYTGMIQTLLDLNRFRLYENLHLKLPRDTDEERKNNVKLMSLLSGNDEVNLRYRHPAADTPSTGDATPTPPKTP